jgi:hypothetical protein
MSSWSSAPKQRATVSAMPDIIPKSRVITGSAIPLVCSVLRGGIGNRLFQIMAGLGYAERTGKQFVFVEKYISDNFHSGFRLSMDMLLAFFPAVKVYRSGSSSWTKYEHMNCRSKDKFYEYEPIPLFGGSVILDGFFQNELYFPVDYRAKFKAPYPGPGAALDELIQTLNFEHTYFIHFRLGDYVDTDYDVGLTEYYRGSISALRKPCNFLIFSDAPDKLNLSVLPVDCTYTIVPKSVGTWGSLYLMSMCAGGICANSTFSWFGGCYSNGGPVFMPAQWHKVITGAPIPVWSQANDVI